MEGERVRERVSRIDHHGITHFKTDTKKVENATGVSTTSCLDKSHAIKCYTFGRNNGTLHIISLRYPSSKLFQYVDTNVLTSRMFYERYSKCSIVKWPPLSVENVAFKKESWINNKRHFKRHIRNRWMHGHAGRAVDGDFDQTLHSCTILDNFYVEKPIWMVDLGRKRKISGVVIVTWQGKGQGIGYILIASTVVPLI